MSLFGNLRGPWNVEKAVLEQLELWLPEYAAEVERQNSLKKKELGRPPVPESYRGGLDWLSAKEDWMPEVKVICNPTGPPEREGIVYRQVFDTQVGCVCKSEEGTDPEAIARRNAGLLSVAAMGVLVQHGDLQGLNIIEETLMIGGPRVEFLEAENRRFAVGITTFLIYAEVIEFRAGPEGTTPKGSPGYEGFEEPFKEAPEVVKDTITLKAFKISEEV